MELDNELEKIIEIYEELLINSEEVEITKLIREIQPRQIVKTFRYKGDEIVIIDQITSLLSLIRKRIESISDKLKMEKSTSFSLLEDYHTELSEKIEYEDGILSLIEKKEKINSELKKLRSLIYLIVKTLSIFISEEILQIEKLTDITLRLRELGIIHPAEILESLSTEKMDSITKMTKIRSSFEQIVIEVLESHKIKVTKNFFHNLDALAQNNLIKKPLQKSFSKHYSFVSQIIHEEIEASKENISYGLNIILEIILKLLSLIKQ